MHSLCILSTFKCPTSLQLTCASFDGLLQDLNTDLLTASTFHSSCVTASVSSSSASILWNCRVCLSNCEWAQCFLASCNRSCSSRRVSQALCITNTQSVNLTNRASHWLNTNQLVSDNGWHNTANHGKNHAVKCGDVAGSS